MCSIYLKMHGDSEGECNTYVSHYYGTRGTDWDGICMCLLQALQHTQKKRSELNSTWDRTTLQRNCSTRLDSLMRYTQNMKSFGSAIYTVVSPIRPCPGRRHTHTHTTLITGWPCKWSRRQSSRLRIYETGFGLRLGPGSQNRIPRACGIPYHHVMRR
jgi:hypothetical protein